MARVLGIDREADRGGLSGVLVAMVGTVMVLARVRGRVCTGRMHMGDPRANRRGVQERIHADRSASLAPRINSPLRDAEPLPHRPSIKQVAPAVGP